MRSRKLKPLANRPLIITGAVLLVGLIGAGLILYWRSLTPSTSPSFYRIANSTYAYEAKLPLGQITTSLGTDSQGAKIKIEREGTSIEMNQALPKVRLTTNKDTATFTGAQSELKYTYELQPSTLKEDIIISKVPTSNKFTSVLKLDGLTLRTNASNLPVFYDAKGKYQFHIAPPFALDAKGQRTEAVRYHIEKVDNKDALAPSPYGKHRQNLLGLTNEAFGGSTYVLITEIDTNWLKDPKRAYPVKIDPTITHSTSSAFANGYLNRVSDTGSGSYPNLIDNYQELPADINTIGLWHMNETSNGTCAGSKDVCDSSGNGNHGTVSGTTINTTTQILGGGARTFNGSSDYIDLGAPTTFGGITSFTISAWIYPTSVTGEHRIFDRGSSGNPNAILFYQSGANLAILVNNTDSLVYSSAFVPNNWYHVAVTFIGGGAEVLYLNGVPVANRSATQTSPTAGSINTRIGCISNWSTCAASTAFSGIIDEVRFSNVAQSAEEIRMEAQRRPYATYTSPATDLTYAASAWNSFKWTAWGNTTGNGETASNSAGLLAQWNFNETSGTTATNGAGVGTCGGTASNCDGTLTNFASTTSQDQAPLTGWTTINSRWGAGALMFDGTDDTVTIPTAGSSAMPSGSTARTTSAWIFPRSGTARSMIISYGGSTDTTRWDMEVNGWFAAANGRLVLHVYNAAVVTASTPIVPGKWYYVVVTYSGGGASIQNGIKMYVNGVQQPIIDAYSLTGNGMTLTWTTVPNTTAAGFQIGRRNTDNVGPFPGTIDAVQVYNRELPAYEILSNYNASNIEFQTRTGSTTNPDDGTWDAWKPTTNETTIANFDSSAQKWKDDSDVTNASTLSVTSQIDVGNGADGACTVSGTVNLGVSSCAGRGTADALIATVSAILKPGDTTVVVNSATGLAVGDEVLVIDEQGTSLQYQTVGAYETKRITNIASTTLTLDSPLTYGYDGTTHKIAVQRVPNYTSVTINGGGVLTTVQWNGSTGGTLFFRATGTVTNGGTIDMSGKGYRAGPTYSGTTIGGYSGEGICGLGTNANSSTRVMQNCGGGGAAWDTSYNTGLAEGGGGGGYGAVAADGTYSNTSYKGQGSGGISLGAPPLGRLLKGGGGGAGGSGYNGSAWGQGNGTTDSRGGNGGGIIAINAATITNNGNITTTGTTGNNGWGYTTSCGQSICGGGGGGGAGGTVYLAGNSIALGSNTINVAGGASTPGGGGSYSVLWTISASGAGSPGRIAVYYTTSLTGTSTQTDYTQIIASQTKMEGTGSARLSLGATQTSATTMGLWHLDDTGSTLSDASGNGNTGTDSGGTTVVDGYNGKARYFNGSNNITINDNSTLDPTTNQITIETWVKTTQATDGLIIYKFSGSPYPGYGMQISGATQAGKAGCWVGGSAWTYGSAAVNDGHWHHVACTYNGTNVYVYTDGVANSPQAQTASLSSTATMYIGSGLTGYMDEVRILNTTLRADEIAEDARAGANHRFTREISATNLSSITKLPFYIASDRQGTFLEATIGSSAWANYEPDVNTVFLFHFDQPIPSATDYFYDNSYYDNVAKRAGTIEAPGKIGGGRSFSGTGQFINLYSPTTIDFGNNGPFTLAGWVKPNSLQDYASFLSKTIAGRTATYSFMTVFMANGRLMAWNASAGWVQICPAGSITAGNWSHVAFAYDGSTMRGYVNGSICGSAAWTYTDNAAYEMTLGSWYSPATTYDFNGQMDEISVSNISRSAAEIRAAYDYAQRSHDITIDFKAKLDPTGLITNSGTTSFVIDSTPYGGNSKGDKLYVGDKLIIKETIAGIEYIAQAYVTANTTSTGAINVAAWDSGSTFPPSGFTANATVFKWQREYFDISGSVAASRTAINRLTLRITDANQGANVWIDDLRSNTGYLNTPTGSTVTSAGAGNRYIQYRAILSTNDYNTSASLSSVSVDYTSYSPPNIPTLDLPTNSATKVALAPVFKTTTTDPEGSWLRYKIKLCTDINMTLNCQTFDQTVSQTGWSGQDTQSGTAYTSGTQATYTLVTPLQTGTNYYWQSWAIDPANSGGWGATQASPNTFRTSYSPSAPTNLMVDTLTSPAITANTAPVFTAQYNDSDTSDVASYYHLQVNTKSDFTGTMMWDSGNAATSVNQGSSLTGATYAGTALTNNTTYYWRIAFIDAEGAVGTWSTTAQFTYTPLDTLSCSLIKNDANTTIRVQWTNTNTIQNLFRVEKNLDNAGFSPLNTVGSSTLYYDDSTISSGHTYQYRVRAEQGLGNSPWCTTSVLNLSVDGSGTSTLHFY